MPPNGSEKDILETASISAASTIIATSLSSFILNLILQTGLSKLIGMLKNLQIIVHILLIQVYLAPHTEFFLEQLSKIIAF
jgi:hypothetical protein